MGASRRWGRKYERPYDKESIKLHNNDNHVHDHRAMTQQKLIIMTRYPEAGKTKTRMIPALGAEGAAKLQKQLTEKTVAIVEELQQGNDVTLYIYFSGGSLELMQQWLGDRHNYYEQSSGDLGKKLTSALQESFTNNSTKIVFIGIDCPDLTSTILAEAFSSLDNYDLVLGPAADGGYYLIGLSRLLPQLFEGIDWGTSVVFSQTQKIAQQLNLKINYLPTLRDLDRPEDLE